MCCPGAVGAREDRTPVGAPVGAREDRSRLLPLLLPHRLRAAAGAGGRRRVSYCLSQGVENETLKIFIDRLLDDFLTDFVPTRTLWIL